MSLATIVSKFEAFASEVVSDAVEEGKEFVEDVAVAGENRFEELVGKIGKRATEFVTDLMSDDTLSGLEKNNLAVTQLVDHAAQSGIELAAHDATTLIKNAFLAVEAKIASL